MPNYTIIGNWAYQPGSAAAKRAQQLYNAMPRQVTPQNSLSAYTAAPRQTAPANFPSYPAGTPTAGRGGGGNTLSPGPTMTGQGAFGLVPTMPSPISTAAGSIGGNQTNLPALSTLATDTTRLNANLGALPYQMNLPNYGGMLGQSSSNISSNLAGVIDPQQWSQLQQRMAERGASMGISPTSPNFNTGLMTALNQSILGTQQLGQQQLNAAIARTPTGQPFNVAGQQIGPADMQAAQYEANKLGAAPDPAMAAQANLDMLLRAIEAGRAGANPGYGGGGGGGMPGFLRMPSAPGAMAVAPYYGGGGQGSYYAPNRSYQARTTTPGASSPDYTQNFEAQYLSKMFNPGSGSYMTPSDTVGALTDPLNLGGYNMPAFNQDEYDWNWYD